MIHPTPADSASPRGSITAAAVSKAVATVPRPPATQLLDSNASFRSAPSSNRREPDSLRLLKEVGVVSGTVRQCGGSLRRRRRSKTVAPHWVGAGPQWWLVVRRRSCVAARLVAGRLPRCRPGRRGLLARR